MSGGVTEKAITSESAAAAAAEAEYLGAMTSVWWHIDSCPVPRRGCDVKAILKNIKSALVNLGYHGPVSISAFGETDDMTESVKRDLSSIEDISLEIGLEYDIDTHKELLFAMMVWALDHPAPANFLLISGDDRVYAPAIHHLAKRGYNILLAHPEDASCDSLVAAAKTVWLWNDLLAGGRYPIPGEEMFSNIPMIPVTTVSGGGSMKKDTVSKAYRKAKTSVWWDIDDCPVPTDCTGMSFAKNIRRALSNYGCKGPVSFFAFGCNVDLLPGHIQSALAYTMTLNPLTSGEKELGDINATYSSEKKMIVEMFAWALENAAPANVLLLSGDPSFIATMEALRDRGFNVLLGTHLVRSCLPLVDAVTTPAWSWLDLLLGLPPADWTEVRARGRGQEYAA